MGFAHDLRRRPQVREPAGHRPAPSSGRWRHGFCVGRCSVPRQIGRTTHRMSQFGRADRSGAAPPHSTNSDRVPIPGSASAAIAEWPMAKALEPDASTILNRDRRPRTRPLRFTVQLSHPIDIACRVTLCFHGRSGTFGVAGKNLRIGENGPKNKPAREHQSLSTTSPMATRMILSGRLVRKPLPTQEGAALEQRESEWIVVRRQSTRPLAVSSRLGSSKAVARGVFRSTQGVRPGQILRYALRSALGPPLGR